MPYLTSLVSAARAKIKYTWKGRVLISTRSPPLSSIRVLNDSKNQSQRSQASGERGRSLAPSVWSTQYPK
jgi:hypothetical protein